MNTKSATNRVAVVAAMFQTSPERVKAQYKRNAAQLRECAEQAGSGKYRGKTATQWTYLAKRAEQLSQ